MDEFRKEKPQREVWQDLPPEYGGQSSGPGNPIPPPGCDSQPPPDPGNPIPPGCDNQPPPDPGNPIPPGCDSQPPPWYERQTSQTGGMYYWQEPAKSESIGFGIASLVLGILSILLFCTCINWLTGILAIIFGIIQLVKGGKKGLAVGGIVTAALSILFTIVFYFLMFCLGVSSDSYNDYYDYYDYYKDYYDDSYDSDKEEFL